MLQIDADEWNGYINHTGLITRVIPGSTPGSATNDSGQGPVIPHKDN